ncbi:MAG: hypothetical protein WDN75_07980 [Bacteroidota bacterium]
MLEFFTPSLSGSSFIVLMNPLSAVRTYHSRQRKNRKKMTKEITGQMAMLSML